MTGLASCLLLPSEFSPDTTQFSHIRCAPNIAWSGELRGDTGAGGEDTLRVERMGYRADLLQEGLAALHEAGVLIGLVPGRNLAAQGGEMMPQAIGTAPQFRCHHIHGWWRRLC